MTNGIASLLDILDLETLEHNLFRGRSPQVGWQRVFGGQVIGQALVAATRTVPLDRHAHSLHGYFLRPGDPSVPIIYEVDRIRDGSSFLTRRVIAVQHGEAIFSMSASFQKEEDGFDHQTTMPDVPAPEELMSEAEFKQLVMASKAPEAVKAYWRRERPIEFRPVDLEHYISRKALPPEQMVWFRATGAVPSDGALQKCMLAYASDMTLLDTALFPHGRSVFSQDMQVASLDHAMWFLRPFDTTEWMLYAQESPSASHARGLSRGNVYSRDGRLVASVAQEGLMRPRPLPR
ncbi:acyl-CoA thioesterase II [Afifella sp. IM 167]|uniref:acyl-CoA thioesterase II n=1 Tax=Afifella sp. IM 167 TaxID=2033586 RepID=UPI001CCE2A39|nr:acyl-CoA thioesterase II [Afifella sp. IM 167]MBZ8135049.1 acyl-CoA thioesterase II [Afifella sp. IM 167]